MSNNIFRLLQSREDTVKLEELQSQRMASLSLLRMSAIGSPYLTLGNRVEIYIASNIVFSRCFVYTLLVLKFAQYLNSRSAGCANFSTARNQPRSQGYFPWLWDGGNSPGIGQLVLASVWLFEFLIHAIKISQILFNWNI